jgi:hypothetical protein
MASPTQNSKQFPTPDGTRLRAFLASCPMLAGLQPSLFTQLASELQLLHYDDGTRFFSDVAPDHRSPLRFVVQGRASWNSERGMEQKSAWMMTPGSVFGLEGLNDWARRKQLAGAFDRGETPRVACQAIGPIWVLELPADRFEAAFMSESTAQVLARLLEHVPTCMYAPNIVASMRQNPQFIRASTLHLYKLLEWAPTMRLTANDDNAQLSPNAAYYVIEGALRLTSGAKVKTITTGEMEGADLFRSPSPDDGLSIPVSLGETWAVMLTQNMLHACIRQTPGFARCLGPRNEQGEP